MDKYLKKIYKKEPETVWRMIDGEIVLLPLRDDIDVKDLGSVYILKNKTAMYIWQLIDGEKNVEQIKHAVFQRFRVESDEAESKMLDFINKLEQIKVIVSV